MEKETKDIKVLCYTNETDNTKGTLLAVSSDAELRTDDMIDKINKEIVDSGILGSDEDPMNVYEIARQIAYLGGNHSFYTEYGDYSFYFEEVPMIC